MVQTEADEKLNSASEHVAEAIKDVSAVVVYECEGADDYKEEYRVRLERVLTTLISLRRDLNRP